MTGIFYTPFPAVHIGNLPFLTTELQGEIKKDIDAKNSW